MPAWTHIAFAGLVLISLGQSVLLLLHAWESRRFARRRLEGPPTLTPARRVAVIVPCRGHDLEIKANLGPLLQQDYLNYEILFVVDTPSDAAVESIQRLMARSRRVKARLVISGDAAWMGQKVHNLRAALAELGPEVETLAFIDSDARAAPNWLSKLVCRLHCYKADAVTGYRWFVPLRPTLPNLLIYSINSAVGMLFGSSGRQFVWGGSWAIRREVFQQLGISECWQGTLSDDLVATRVLHQAQCVVEFEPACMVASPVDMSWGQVVEFLRRQYIVGRVYSPHWWAGALAWSVVSNAALFACLVLAVSCGFAGTNWELPALMATLLYATGTLRATIRCDMALRYLPAYASQLRAALWFDVLAWPLASLTNLAGMALSIGGRSLSWRGIRYRLYRDGQARRLNRELLARPYADQQPPVGRRVLVPRRHQSELNPPQTA